MTHVISALMLFQDIHSVQLHGMKQDVFVRITISEQCLVDVQVGISGLGSYFLDGKKFLNHLIRLSLHKLSDSCSIKLWCRQIGVYSTVIVYETSLDMIRSEQENCIKDSTVLRPLDLPELLLEMKQVPILKDSSGNLAHFLYEQLHLFHLINPEVYISLQVKLTLTDSPIQYVFEREPSLSVHTSPFRLLSTTEHYLDTKSVPTLQTKLKVFRGISCTIPEYSSKELSSVALKMYCCVAVLPHLRLTKGKKVPADRICSTLNISIFGPGRIPLLHSESQANFNLNDLAVWDNYGINIGAPLKSHSNRVPRNGELSPHTSTFAFQLKTKRASSKFKTDRILQMFLFFEIDRDQSLRHIQQQWEYDLTVSTTLRNEFSSLVSTESKKFQKIFHSALNKMFCNYGSFLKLSSSVTSSLPPLTEAVNDIIKHSTNKRFKQQCIQIMQTQSVDEVQKQMLTKLSRIAEKSLNIRSNTSTSTSKAPEEPTTPELELAISEGQNLQPQGSLTQESETILNSTHGSNEKDYCCTSNDRERPSLNMDTDQSHLLKTRLPVEEETDFETLAEAPGYVPDVNQIFANNTCHFDDTQSITTSHSSICLGTSQCSQVIDDFDRLTQMELGQNESHDTSQESSYFHITAVRERHYDDMEISDFSIDEDKECLLTAKCSFPIIQEIPQIPSQLSSSFCTSDNTRMDYTHWMNDDSDHEWETDMLISPLTSPQLSSSIYQPTLHSTQSLTSLNNKAPTNELTTSSGISHFTLPLTNPLKTQIVSQSTSSNTLSYATDNDDFQDLETIDFACSYSPSSTDHSKCTGNEPDVCRVGNSGIQCTPPVSLVPSIDSEFFDVIQDIDFSWD